MDADNDTVSLELNCATCTNSDENEKPFMKLVTTLNDTSSYRLVIEEGGTKLQDLGSYDYELVT